MSPPCKLRHDLAAEFATAARLYAETVVDWVRSASQEDHVRLRKIMEDAHTGAIRAALLYEAHMDSHDCCDGPPNVHNIVSLRQKEQAGWRSSGGRERLHRPVLP
jgi:hypothetical protein